MDCAGIVDMMTLSAVRPQDFLPVSIACIYKRAMKIIGRPENE